MSEDLPTRGVRQGDVLFLSGRGYRAALFHLGALTRLNELGLLAGVETVGARAGGSILAALLASRMPWPLEGAYREWPEAVAEPMRAIARRNARAMAILRGTIGGDDAIEERFARELIVDRGPGPGEPRLVFGGAGLSLGEMSGSAVAPGALAWEIEAATEHGYDPMLVADVIATVRTDLDAFGEPEQAVLENHGYQLADSAVRGAMRARVAGVEPLPPEPPHPRWMEEIRVREALAASSRRRWLGRMRPRQAQRRRRAIGLHDPESVAILERHRPIVQYDSLECYRADSAATITGLAMGQRCNSLRRADGTAVASTLPAPDGDAAALDLDFLGPAVYANGEPVREGDYLEESGGAPAADARAMRRRQGHADVVYGRAAEDRDGSRWLQYFFFYYYNDKGLLNVGLHEGDWEALQLLLGEDGEIEAATFAQHSLAERVAGEELERRGEEEAVVVYSARGSHSSLPGPGTRWAPIVPDHNDGGGAAIRPHLVAIGEEVPGWVGWPGRWGATSRREAFEGTSPRGPARQPLWLDPAGFHREARQREDTSPWIAPEPPAPALSARLDDGGAAVVEYRFAASNGIPERPDRLLVAPFNAGADEPARTQSFGVDGRHGTAVLSLPPGGQFDGVRACVVTERGAPGATLTAPFDE